MNVNLNNNFLTKISFFYLIYYYYSYRLLFELCIIYSYINLIDISHIGFNDNTFYFLFKILINILFTIYSNIEYYVLNYIKSNKISYIGYAIYIKINNLLILFINKIYNKSITIISNKIFNNLNIHKNNLDNHKNNLDNHENNLNNHENNLNTKEDIYNFFNKIKSQ